MIKRIPTLEEFKKIAHAYHVDGKSMIEACEISGISTKSEFFSWWVDQTPLGVWIEMEQDIEAYLMKYSKLGRIISDQETL